MNRLTGDEEGGSLRRQRARLPSPVDKVLPAIEFLGGGRQDLSWVRLRAVVSGPALREQHFPFSNVRAVRVFFGDPTPVWVSASCLKAHGGHMRGVAFYVILAHLGQIHGFLPRSGSGIQG